MEDITIRIFCVCYVINFHISVSYSVSFLLLNESLFSISSKSFSLFLCCLKFLKINLYSFLRTVKKTIKIKNKILNPDN